MCSRTQFTDLTYMGGSGPCGPITIIFGSVIQSWHTRLNINYGVNRKFHVLKNPVYRFDLYWRYEPCGPMTIILGSIIQSQHASLNIKFGVNRTFHVHKTTVYRFDLYGRYWTLWTDDDNFWQFYSELVYQIWCGYDVSCAQDPSLEICLIWEVPGPLDR